MSDIQYRDTETGEFHIPRTQSRARMESLPYIPESEVDTIDENLPEVTRKEVVSAAFWYLRMIVICAVVIYLTCHWFGPVAEMMFS